jgi:hypothetical protein
MRHPAAQPPLQAHSPRQNYHTFKKTPKSISCSWRQLHCILEQVNLNLAVKPTTKHAKCAKGIDYQDIAKKKVMTCILMEALQCSWIRSLKGGRRRPGGVERQEFQTGA